MPGKVKSLSEIAQEYGVHINTLRNWLKPIREKLKLEGKKLLLPWQVKIIYEFLDEP
ncbi:MAG: hypothetical protein V2A54_13235 [Bacteroidota bacterium]